MYSPTKYYSSIWKSKMSGNNYQRKRLSWTCSSIICIATYLFHIHRTNVIRAFSPATFIVANLRPVRKISIWNTVPLVVAKNSDRSTALYYEGKGDYYGEGDSSFMIQEFSTFDGLEEIVRLAAKPLPERPDGIVAVVKFTSAIRKDCRDTEAGYERLARDNPDTVFLRCFEEYQNADLLLGQAEVTSLPTFDIFYGGSRVGRVEGPDYDLVQKFIKNYGMINSKLDLFSEEADNKRRLQWGDGKVKDWRKTPRTTARFIPGYDWDKDKGFFDDFADKQAQNFESQFENWIPPQDGKKK